MEEIVATLLHTNRFQSVVVLTPSQGRFPWRGKLHRRGWPSSGCPDGPSCSPCRPIADRDGGSRACAQCGDLLACLCRWRKKGGQFSVFLIIANLVWLHVLFSNVTTRFCLGRVHSGRRPIQMCRTRRKQTRMCGQITLQYCQIRMRSKMPA